MTFFDFYQEEFSAFAKSKKTDKNFKKLKTRKEKTLIFLNEKGNILSKNLEKFVKNDEKINFSLLPPEVRNFLGVDKVAEIKRQLVFDNNSILIKLSNQNFIFNQGNAIFGTVGSLISSKFYLKKLFIGENIIDSTAIDNEEDKEIRQIVIDLIQIYEDNGATGIETISGNNFKIVTQAVKETLKLFSEENGNGKSAVWSLYGLYSVTKQHKGKYCLFINIEDYTDSP